VCLAPGPTAVPLPGRYFVSDLHHALSAHLHLHGLGRDAQSALARRLARGGAGLSGRRSHCLRLLEILRRADAGLVEEEGVGGWK
jgi:hypothetical protein